MQTVNEYKLELELKILKIRIDSKIEAFSSLIEDTKVNLEQADDISIANIYQKALYRYEGIVQELEELKK